ncbi:MAG: peptidase M3 [Deltaproteobacteria bacterium]|nr:peptidase M3 [Deltaproteobacteria bacterium]
MASLESVLDALKDRYTELHSHKEDLFWASKMGLTEDPGATRRALAEAEIACNRFLQDPERLRLLRDLEARREGSSAQQHVLRGWIAMLRANTIEDPAARALSEEIVAREAELQDKRAALQLGFRDPATGRWEEASCNRLSLLLRNDPDEARRRAAWEALGTVEAHVLQHGFLDIVAARNRLGRALGFEDYYDWRTTVVEGLSRRDLFVVLEDLAERTRARSTAELQAFVKVHGEGALRPWNFLFLRQGSLAAQLDPYWSLGEALGRWGRSFSALGVRYRGATLTLDLVDRAGKYENGFMHGPGIAFRDRGVWRPARINFTANAVPGAVGSGLRATETLFHEGGHAAHFANVLSDAPCFAQEFAPTSVAYAETQSMFMDALLEDPDWRRRYLRDPSGRPVPVELLEASVREAQPLRAWDVRAMLTVPMAERRLYQLSDAERTPEAVLQEFRRVETDLQGLTAGVRPVLAVPHLLTGEASAYYHAYVMAEMAVYQTRAFFLARDGYLVDNPRVGPDLAERYWAPGNAVPFNELLQGLTGSALSADAIVAACDRSADEAVREAREALAREPSIARPTGPVDLGGTVRVVHGRDTVASTEGGSFEGACEAFERWARAL